MHKLNVLVLGPKNFLSTLDELQNYLKFNIVKKDNNSLEKLSINNDIILIHEDEDQSKNLSKIKTVKILATSNKKKDSKLFDNIIKLPTTLKEINETIENTLAKVKFNQNSSIKLKEYLLNKNEKKLTKNDDFVILTEKEIQLLELLLNNNDPVSKNKILSTVWNYSTDADTHTVETHIYRLRKKINDKFFDSKFILNNKQGYYFWKKEIKLQLICSVKNIAKELLNPKKEKEVLKELKSSLF